MPLVLANMPQVSWERVDGVRASQTFVTEAGTYQVALRLSRPSNKIIEVFLRPRGDARPGIDYSVRQRVVKFLPGRTYMIVSVHFPKQDDFTTPKTLDLVATPHYRFKRGRVARGDYAVWRFNIAMETTPPTLGFTGDTTIDVVGHPGDQARFGLTLAGASTETTVVRIVWDGSSLMYGAQFVVTGEYWNPMKSQFEIPPGVTVSDVTVHYLGHGGFILGSLLVEPDNVRRNEITFSGYGDPETGLVDGTEAGYDSTRGLRDDARGEYAQPTDWLFETDVAGPSTQWPLIRADAAFRLNPDGSPASLYAPNDADGGAVRFGGIQKSAGTPTVGGRELATIHAGYNIWSAMFRNEGTEPGFTQAEYSDIELLNVGVVNGMSDDPNPASHKVRVQWSNGTPSINLTSNVDSSGIESMGDDWYRVWLIYDAPAEAAGDEAQWIARPCVHPTEAVSLHFREGCYAWGAQFEYDATRTVTEPTPYQHVSSHTWYAGLATAGDQTSFSITLENPNGDPPPDLPTQADPIAIVGNNGVLPARQDLPPVDILVTGGAGLPTVVEIISDQSNEYTVGQTFTVPDNNNLMVVLMPITEAFWEFKNGANEALLGDNMNRLLFGELVHVSISGRITERFGSFSDGFQSIGQGQTAKWGRIFIRDIAFVGATGTATDWLGSHAWKWNDGSWGANLRFENLTLKCGVSSNANQTVSNDPDDVGDRSYGAMRFYECRIEGHPLGGPHGGQKWGIKGSGRACWDVRNCSFGISEEHCAYVDSPQGFFYAVDNIVDAGVGNGRTMFQTVDRYAPDGITGPAGNNPGPHSYGVILWARNVSWDNSLVQQSGGADFTVAGFHGDIYLLDNESHGGAGPLASSTRASVSVWADSTEVLGTGGFRHDIHIEFDQFGNPYVNKRVVFSGHILDIDGADRYAISFSSCNEILIYPFSFIDSHPSRPQLQFNNWLGNLGDALNYPNTPGNVRFIGFPIGDLADFSGWNPAGGSKITHGHLDGINTSGLTDAQINVYDGNDPV